MLNICNCLVHTQYFMQLKLFLNSNAHIASAGKCCHPRLLSEGVSTCWLMWFIRSGSCSGLVGRNQLWHSCTNGPFYWANQSGSPGLGPLPRKHSLEGVSPYPCALAERSQYYHCTVLTLSPPLSFPLPPTPALSTPVISVLFYTSAIIVPLSSSWLYSPPVLLLLSCSATPYTLSNLTDCHQETVICREMSDHLLLQAVRLSNQL